MTNFFNFQPGLYRVYDEGDFGDINSEEPDLFTSEKELMEKIISIAKESRAHGAIEDDDIHITVEFIIQYCAKVSTASTFDVHAILQE